MFLWSCELEGHVTTESNCKFTYSNPVRVENLIRFALSYAVSEITANLVMLKNWPLSGQEGWIVTQGHPNIVIIYKLISNDCKILQNFEQVTTAVETERQD